VHFSPAAARRYFLSGGGDLHVLGNMETQLQNGVSMHH